MPRDATATLRFSHNQAKFYDTHTTTDTTRSTAPRSSVFCCFDSYCFASAVIVEALDEEAAEHNKKSKHRKFSPAFLPFRPPALVDAAAEGGAV